MDIYVLDGLNGIADIVETYESSIWNIQYFGQNDFQLVVAATAKNIDLLKPGAYLVREVDMSDQTYNNVMVVQDYKLDFDLEKGWMLTLTGKGLKNDLLKRRIVWTQTNLTGLAEVGIRQVITENIINPSDSNRQIENFVLDTINNFTDVIEIQLLGENIATWLEQICMTYGYGWDVYINNGQYVFKLYKGTNRSYDQSEVTPIVFSPEYDNLLTSSYSHNMTDYKNAALIGGEGEGTNQRTATIGTSSGLSRYEAYIDGGSVSSNGEIITVEQYTKMLEEYGQTQLSQTAFTEHFSGDIDPGGMYIINEDYYLGDIVQVDNENGISAVTRIIEIIYAEDENGSSVVPTFSEWEVDN
jgi:hypothetical protein